MLPESTSGELALRRELRAYFAQLLTPEVRNEIDGANEDHPVAREIIRQMGRDGWLGLGWPTQYGGQGRGVIDQFILFDEVYRAGAPFPFVTINTVGPTLQTFGTQEQKDKYLPGIVSGEILFAIGYSEPDAGTDLASLRTRAVRREDGWVINGNKVFTSGAGQADYIWLATRTDPEAPKHRGISIFIVPTSDPGFSVTPILTTGSSRTNATYYQDVAATDADIVGGLNQGWQILTSQLGHERIGLAAMGGRTQQLFDDVLAWARSTRSAEGDALADLPENNHVLGATHARLVAMRLLNRKTVQVPEGETPDPVVAAMAKVFSSEMHDEVCHDLMGMIGPSATRRGAAAPVLAGRVERLTRGSYVNTFGGGSNEVLRDMIATMGQGLPRRKRDLR